MTRHNPFWQPVVNMDQDWIVAAVHKITFFNIYYCHM